jgi:hypothetical protein
MEACIAAATEDGTVAFAALRAAFAAFFAAM